MISHKFEAIGTAWCIDIYTKIENEKYIFSKLHKIIDEFDLIYSRFRTDSWVYNQSLKKGQAQIPPDFSNIFEIYKKLNLATNGLFTPLIGKTLSDAGYDKDYSLKPKKRIYRPPDLLTTIKVKDDHIYFEEKVLLDIGACGKGYLVDKIYEFLMRNNVEKFVIDAGGDLRLSLKDLEPIRIGLEHPDDQTLAIGVVEMNFGSICASAGNRRKWSNFTHTINPQTLTSPTEIKSSWVIADTAFIADALATCLILEPEAKMYKDFSFEFLLLYKDNTYQKSDNFKAQLFT